MPKRGTVPYFPPIFLQRTGGRKPPGFHSGRRGPPLGSVLRIDSGLRLGSGHCTPPADCHRGVFRLSRHVTAREGVSIGRSAGLWCWRPRRRQCRPRPRRPLFTMLRNVACAGGLPPPEGQRGGPPLGSAAQKRCQTPFLGGPGVGVERLQDGEVAFAAGVC
jgi:hypothetical protein